MSEPTLDEFRALLEDERDAHRSRDRLPRTRTARGRWRTRSASFGGRGVDNHLARHGDASRFDRELDEGLEEGAQQTLDQIDRALAKLDDGTFGTCERCGKPIGEERLRARPWATLCIDDQRLADRG